MRPIRGALLCLLSLATGASAQQDASWSRVVGPGFALAAELPPAQAAAVARRFESFQSALGEATGSAVPSLLPPFVVVFATDRRFSEFLPQGQTARVAAFVGLDEAAPCLAFHLDAGDESYRAAFREYARVLLRRAPLWFMEGAAEVYATTGTGEDGAHARLGEPNALDLVILKTRFLPLPDLLQTTRAQPGPEGQAFYATSWALAHYLLTSASLSRQVPAYLARVSAGRSAVRAFEETFGPLAAVEKELRRHVAAGAAATRDVQLAPAREAMAMAPAAIGATLGRLLFYAKRDEEAARRLRDAAAADPSLAGAQLALGILRLGQDGFEEAFERLEKAEALEPGSLGTAYYLARAALQVAGSVDEARLEKARAALAGRLGPETRVPGAWEVLGTLSGRLGHLEEAEHDLRRALDLEPGRLSSILELADVCVVRQRFDEAGRLLDSAQQPAARAGVDLGPWRERVAREREAATVRADLAKAAGLPAAPPALLSEGRRTGRWLLPPEYRALASGEERIHGLLRGIECRPDGNVFDIATAEGTLRFEARRLVDVRAISYREGFEPMLSCGRVREVEPVFVTWRPAPSPTGGVKGTVVALEFLGEEYLPGPTPSGG